MYLVDGVELMTHLRKREADKKELFMIWEEQQHAHEYGIGIVTKVLQ